MHTHNHHIISTRNQLPQVETNAMWPTQSLNNTLEVMFPVTLSINHGNFFSAKQNNLAAFQVGAANNYSKMKVVTNSGRRRRIRKNI